jgi:hypothetical protein
MPIVQVLGPYPTFATVMNLARSYVNDTMAGITGATGEGQIFTNSAPMTVPFLRAVVAELYQELGNTGAGVVIRDNYVLTGITPVNGANGLSTPDPTTQVNLGYAGYYDGQTTNANLVLPPDFIAPLKVRERLNGTTDTFQDVREATNGLDSRQQSTYQAVYEWRQDAIYMPGSLQTVDLSLRYICALPLLDTSTDLEEVAVPISDCENALALKLAANYGFARGSDQVQQAEQKAEKAVRLLQNRFIRAQQAVDYHAQPYGPSSNLWPLA